MYLGTMNYNKCYLSDQSANFSVLMTGQSGSGKTCRMHQMELNSAMDGNTVIVIETCGSHTKDQIFPDIHMSYSAFSNHIDVCKDGLYIPLLPAMYSTELTSSQINFIESVVNTFAIPAKLGTKQTGIFRNAILYAMKNVSLYPTEMDAIISGLTVQEKLGVELYNQFWSLFNYKIFRTCNNSLQLTDHSLISDHSNNEIMQLMPGRINIIDLLELDEMTQKIVSDMLIFSLFNFAKKKKENDTLKTNYIIFIDEFQNFQLGKYSMTKKMLHEGRKYHINLVLATQSMDCFSSSIIASVNQAATKLYFQPNRSETFKLAKEIAPDNIQYWKTQLTNLRIGESIVTGKLQIGDAKINRPMILK